jgi:hypothetical protein
MIDNHILDKDLLKLWKSKTSASSTDHTYLIRLAILLKKFKETDELNKVIVKVRNLSIDKSWESSVKLYIKWLQEIK